MAQNGETSTAIQVMNNIPETLSKVIDTLGKKLGASGEALFHIMVKQQIVYGMQYTFEAIIELLLVIFWYKFCYNYVQDREGNEGKGATLCFSLIFTTILLWRAIYCIDSAFPYFINPQYYAILDIMSMVH